MLDFLFFYLSSRNYDCKRMREIYLSERLKSGGVRVCSPYCLIVLRSGIQCREQDTSSFINVSLSNV